MNLILHQFLFAILIGCTNNKESAKDLSLNKEYEENKIRCNKVYPALKLAEFIYSEYVKNSVKAEEQFKRQFFCFQGEVTEISKTLKGEIYFCIGLGHPYWYIQCLVKDVTDIENIEVGHYVIGKGSYHSIFYQEPAILNLRMKNCSVVAKNTSAYFEGSTIKDIDGNIYNSVIIGEQTWMKENLKVTKYRNGDPIETSNSHIPNDISSKYQWAYKNDDSNVTTNGRLYTWWAVTDKRNVCPLGWHVPSDYEWFELIYYIGGGSVEISGKLKEAGTNHWNSPNTSADNSSNFTSLPSGFRESDGFFNNLGIYGGYWSTTEFNASDAWNYGQDYISDTVFHERGQKSAGLSVRCLKD